MLLGACAAPETKQLIASPPVGLPVRTVLSDVPFLSQQAYYCGPASLAMVMNYHGLSVSQESLARAVYVPELKGSLQAEMLAATRTHGMLAYVLTPNLRSLLEEIAAGHPVAVLQNLGVRWMPVWHYAVAIGYDLEAQEIILHSGQSRGYRVGLTTFERTWARGDHWALVPLPPSMLPADDSALRVLEAAAALEQTGQTRAAQKAYAAAATRWPHNLVAQMGIGNTSYALSDIKAAADAFLAAARAHPESAAAYNNLAITLSELGCAEAAHEAAHRAVTLGHGMPQYLDTMQQVTSIEAKNASPAQCPVTIGAWP